MSAEKRQRIAEELLSTERTYVEQLQVLQNVFEEPLRNKAEPHNPAHNPAHNGSMNVPLIPPKTISSIFSNLTELLNLNKELLTQLSQRIETDWEESGQCLGDIFVKISPFLKLYSVYVANYDTALGVVMEQKKQNQAFSAFLFDCFQLPECKSLTFEAYLITPIQRIPRYKMLFQDLLKHTPDTHPDYKNLEKSFQVIDEVARYVNQNIKDQENMEKLLVIQNSISGLPDTLLVPGRKLLKEGILMKVCRKSNKPRIFFLFSDVLVYGDVLGEKSYKHHLTIPIENVHVTVKEDTEALQNCFYIASSHKSFKVFTESPEQREAWAKAVTEAAEARRRNKKTLRVEAGQTDADRLSQWRQSYLAPVWIPDSDAGGCMICISDFTMIKRRHHCRHCGRVVCGGCCPKRSIPWLSDSAIRVCTECYPAVANPPSEPSEMPEMLETEGSGNSDSDSESAYSTDEEPETSRLSPPPRKPLPEASLRLSQLRTLSPPPPPQSQSQAAPVSAPQADLRRQKSLDALRKNPGKIKSRDFEVDIHELQKRTPNALPVKTEEELQQTIANLKRNRRRSVSCPPDPPSSEVVKRTSRSTYSGYMDTVRRSVFLQTPTSLPLTGWIVEKSGYVNKKGLINTSSKRRWLVATSLPGSSIETVYGKLWYYRNENDKTALGVIDLTTAVKISEYEDQQNPASFFFQLETDSRVYYFSLDSEQERNEWILVLQRIVDSLAFAKTGIQFPLRGSGDRPNSPGDKVVKQGLLTKQGNRVKSWKIRWFTLTPTHLTYHKGFQKELIDRIPLSVVEKIEDGYSRSGIHNSLVVVTPARTYLMYAESSQDRDDWLIELNKWVKVSRSSI